MRTTHPASVFTSRRWPALLSAVVLAIACVARAASGFNDDFEDQNISDWTTRCGSWQIVPGFGGGYAVASTSFDNVLISSTLTASYGHYHYDLYLPNDFRADGDLIFQISGSAGLWILLGPNNSDNVADRIMRVSNGGVGPMTAVGCGPFHLTPGAWHSVDVLRFPNGVIQVFTDNEASPRMEALETTVSIAGQLALRTAVAGVCFDNVSFDPALPANPPPPSASSCPSWNGLLMECSVGPAVPPPPTPQCSDGVDNDHDGCADFPCDGGCTSASDDNESGGTCCVREAPGLSRLGMVFLALLLLGTSLLLTRRAEAR